MTLEKSNLPRVYFILAAYFVIVGVFGWLRSGSVVPFLITGGAGTITAFLGWKLSSDTILVRRLGMGWLGIFAAASLYSAFGKISAHTEARPEAIYIFLSMATLGVVAFIFTFLDLKKRKQVR